MHRDNRQAHLRSRLTFVKEATGQEAAAHHDLLLGIFVCRPSGVVNFSPELVRCGVRPLFVHHGFGECGHLENSLLVW